MSRLRERAETLWNGAAKIDHTMIMSGFGPLEEVAPRLAFVESFANVTALDTGDGLVLFDTGSPLTAATVHKEVRGWRSDPLAAAVFTHGHVDHAMGMPPWDDEAARLGRARPRVIAHDQIRERFARYKLTAGWNTAINRRQFRIPGFRWPTEYRDPDETFASSRTLVIGDTTIELAHAQGETDDHVWAWLPAQKAIITGDLFIWAAPNCGNPQKVQRYVREWADALELMRARNAELLLPGHGPPIFGAARVAQALADTAALLRTIHDQVVALMNEGRRLDDVAASVRIPDELIARPFLRPVYDDPQFVVRNVWRRYGGWWDGNPARLLPPRDHALAITVADLAGGVNALATRAKEAATKGDLALACQLAEWAHQAQPSPATREVRATIYRARAEHETSLMARSIFLAAADE
ncbi:MAG TPA: alkyl sulfatase dimerization domain-containing protein [Kofleriaceae bacterium]|nr:alkyl sulfatase dimerization domain-containing protein [Kofleriaceae bacterium]